MLGRGRDICECWASKAVDILDKFHGNMKKGRDLNIGTNCVRPHDVTCLCQHNKPRNLF
jgi:hypothetical protein